MCESRHKIDSIMVAAVMIILSAQAKQISVARALSALPLLMEDIRCKLAGSVFRSIVSS